MNKCGPVITVYEQDDYEGDLIYALNIRTYAKSDLDRFAELFGVRLEFVREHSLLAYHDAQDVSEAPAKEADIIPFAGKPDRRRPRVNGPRSKKAVA